MVTAAAALSQDVVEVPLLGRVAAGQPILAIEQREDTVQVDRFFLGNHRDVFALRVKGDSMIEAGIHDGDYLFVKQSVARPGDIVVAMINDEATVKYFYPERDRIVFKPANSRLLPIEVKKATSSPSTCSAPSSASTAASTNQVFTHSLPHREAKKAGAAQRTWWRRVDRQRTRLCRVAAEAVL